MAIRRRYGWLAQLEEFVRTNMENDCRALDVVPTLVKYNQSLLHNLRIYGRGKVSVRVIRGHNIHFPRSTTYGKCNTL